MSELAGGLTPPLGRRRSSRAGRRPRALAGLVGLALAAAGALLAAAPWSAGTLQPVAAAALPVLHLTGPAPGSQSISFTLVLRLPGRHRLGSSLGAIENPRSPHFHEFIGPRAFGARFGLAAQPLRTLERQLGARGLRVERVVPQRTQLRVNGTVAAVERLLSTRIGVWSDRSGDRYHAPLRRPQLPAVLRTEVAGVTGLDTRPRLVAHDVPLGGLTPTVAASAYDVKALHDAGFEGQGETIAVISFSAFDPRDPAAFVKRFGITGPAPRVIPVDGGASLSDAAEADLDLEVVRAIAPQAQILFYEVPESTSAYSDVINRIVADGKAKIISSSWGQCERDLFGDQRAGDSRALAAAAAAGVSMFVSSGDSGAYDCQASDFGDHRLTVDWPAASANAISVGGTRLSVSQSDTYLGESGWVGQLSDAGGGGGFSTGDRRPGWQNAPGVQSALSTDHRQVPDVSADADPGTPWAVEVNRRPGEVGGTSAAAPFWAASMLLIQQYAAAHGVSRLGFVDPVLYALARAAQKLPPFHDVTHGTNRYYRATPGWDPATGLGSPDVANLAQDMVAYLHAHGG